MSVLHRAKLDRIDLERFALLYLAVSDMSIGHWVKVRYLPERREWQCLVKVRKHVARCVCGHCPKGENHSALGASILDVLEWARNDLALITKGVPTLLVEKGTRQ